MRARIGRRITGNFRKGIEREIQKFRGNHYLWHRHVTGIHLNPHQVYWMNQIDRVGDSHMLIGSRRIRKSFTVAAYFLEEAMCLPYSEVNVHSPALEQSKRNLRYMHDMVMNSEIALAYIDQRLGEGIGKEHIEFMNRSLIQAKGQASSVDGLGATHQWLEEFDDMDWETFLTRIYPTGSQIKDDHDYGNHVGCCRVITGTIKGIGNLYQIENPENEGIKFNILKKFNCFVPETTVLTANGPKRIDEIKIGDLVVTDKGVWKPVEELHCNEYVDDLIEVTLAYGSGVKIRCTPNHRFFTERGDVRADELNLDDVVLLNDAIPDVDPPQTEFEINEKMAYLLGLYLADGCYGEGKGSSGSLINISFNSNYPEQIDVAEGYIVDLFNKQPHRYNQGNCIHLTVCGNAISEHFLKWCGRYSRGKRIHPAVESWSDYLKASFLRGYFTGDGCEQKNSNGNSTCIASTTVNEKIAIGISRLLTQLGVRPTLTSRMQPAFELRGKQYPETRIYGVQTERIHKIEDIGVRHRGRQGRKAGQVVKIARSYYDGQVFNIGVKDIHSYSLGACGAKVHNCHHGVAMGIIPENDIKLFQSLSTPHQFARTYLALYVESSAFYPDKWVRFCAENEYVPISVDDSPEARYTHSGDVTVGIDAGAAGSGDDSSNWSITFTEKIGNQIFWLYSQEWSPNERPDKIMADMLILFAFFRPVAGFGDAFDTAFLYDLNRLLYENSITRSDVRNFENKQGPNGWDNWFVRPIRFTGPQKHLMHERMQKYIYATCFRYPAIVEDEPGYEVLEKLVKQFGNIKAERSLAGYNKYSVLNTKLGDDIIDSCIASVWAQEEIKVLVAPFGGWVPQMDIGPRHHFEKTRQNFLGDMRKSSNTDDDLYKFLTRG